MDTENFTYAKTLPIHQFGRRKKNKSFENLEEG